jgi:hypothetical protein
MLRKLLVVVSLFVILLPSAARADVSIVQEYCEQVTEGSNALIRVHFAVANFSLQTPVCDLHFTPEPLPVSPGCEFMQIGSPTGWSGVLSPLGGADWFANTPGDCIPAGSLMSGFSFEVTDPTFCCYIVQFTGPTGAVIWEQEECFNCSVVGAQKTSWGMIKAQFE